MKVIMISTDRKIFDADAVVRQRMVRYGSIVDELHIIVLSKQSLHHQDVQLAPNVYAHPTNSLNKLSYASGALSIGRNICRNHKIDLISTQDPFETGWLGYHLAKEFKIALQIQVHTDFLDPHYTEHSFMNGMRVRLAAMLLPQAANIRVVSNRIKERLIKDLRLPEERIFVLPVYVDWSTFARSANAPSFKMLYPQFKKVVLAVGRFEPEKRIDLAVDVFNKATVDMPEVGMIILGDGSERKAIEKKIAKDNLKEKIMVVGWHNDTVPFYQESDVYLHTSVYEGYGMSLAEAAMAELPIVSTDVGIARDLIVEGQTGHICSVDDESCLVNHLKDVLINLPTYTQRAKEKAGEVVLIKSEEEYLTQYKKCLEACL